MAFGPFVRIMVAVEQADLMKLGRCGRIMPWHKFSRGSDHNGGWWCHRQSSVSLSVLVTTLHNFNTIWSYTL